LGALAWLLGATAVGALAWGIETVLLQALQPWLSTTRLLIGAVLMGLLLKPLLSWAMLRSEVLAVDRALQRSLPEARVQLARLVSRDTAQLSAGEVREAAIETRA
jgi:adenosylcobinamide-phosphate synthase